MAEMPSKRLPDPHGMIGRIRSRLNPKCAVKISPFCDYIISMRMQGIPFREIEDWLIKQGEQYRISAPTLYKNLKHTKLQVKLTYAEEMIERMGGTINIDLIREMQQQILTQKERVDGLVRSEKERRQDPQSKNYMDKRLSKEMSLYMDYLTKLHTILSKAPVDALAAMQAQMAEFSENIRLTADAASVLADMILNDEITFVAAELPAITRR